MKSAAAYEIKYFLKGQQMRIGVVISIILGLLVISVLGLILGIIKKNKKLIVLSIIFMGIILTYAMLLYFAVGSFSSGPQIPR